MKIDYSPKPIQYNKSNSFKLAYMEHAYNMTWCLQLDDIGPIHAPVNAASCDTWVSHQLGMPIEIEFGEFKNFLDTTNWAGLSSQDGIYVIYLIPNDKMDQLATLQVSNQYAIYVGATNSSIYRRLHKFKVSLDESVQHCVSGKRKTEGRLMSRNRHAAALHFFEDILDKNIATYNKDTSMFAGVKDHTLMFRVACHDESWICSSTEHERSLNKEMKLVATRTYNTNK